MQHFIFSNNQLPIGNPFSWQHQTRYLLNAHQINKQAFEYFICYRKQQNFKAKIQKKLGSA